MNIEWQFSKDDIVRVKSTIRAQCETIIVKDRQKRNLADDRPTVTANRLWEALVCMRITTQARSGPGSDVSKFQRLRLSTFPLTYDTVRDQHNRTDFISEILKKHKAGRHRPTIAMQLSKNFEELEQDGWREICSQCNLLVHSVCRQTEIEVAKYLQDRLAGFGPKQARNVLQALGLTRYEIPIDSRVTHWLNKELKFPYRVRSEDLSSPIIYRLISDAICALCEKCGVLPCILDAAIFASKDKDDWDAKELVY